jgi:chitodextrinase
MSYASVDRRLGPARSRAAVAAAVTLLYALSAFGPSVATVGAVAKPAVRTAATSLDAPSSALRRYPYLTDVVRTNATVNWATDKSQTTAYATYGISGQESCTAHTAIATRTSITVNSIGEYQWKASFPVAASTAYCYRVFFGTSPSGTDLLGSDPSPVFRSQLATGSTAQFSFAVFGDWGQVDTNGVNPDQARLMAQIAGSGARFAVTSGDNGYPSGSQSNFGDLVQVGSNLSGVFGTPFWSVPGRTIPIFPAIGNHGFVRSDAVHPHLANFPQATAVATSGGRYQSETYCCVDGTTSTTAPSTWYAFDSGNARFYMLEAAWTEANVGTASAYQVDADYHWKPTSAEYQWLEADLKAHPNAVKFAFFHYPLYTANATEPSDTFLQGPGSLEGLLGANGVAIAFNGHAHIYERNRAATGGVISYVTGGGGGKLEPVSRCSNPLIAYAIGWSYSSTTHGSKCGSATAPTTIDRVFHFLLVTVDGNTVTVTPTDELGRTFDVQTYTFGGGSSGDTQAPSTPTNVTASADSATAATVQWSGSTDNVGVAGYTIRRGSTVVGTVGPTVRSFTNTGLAPSTTYSYTVDAFDAADNHSAPSAPASVTTLDDTTPPSVPTGLSASAPSSTRVDLSWQPSSDNIAVTGYRVYRDGTLIASPSATSYSDTTAQPSTAYSYAVAAVDAAGNASAKSTAVNVTTPAGSTTTILFSDGFETGNLSKWTSSSGLVAESATVHAGSWAVEGNTTNGATYAKKTLATTSTSVHASVWYRIASASSQVNLLRVRTSTDTSIGYVYVSSTGTLGLRDDAGAVTLTSSVVPGAGWHLLELTLTIGTSGASSVSVDGATVASLSKAGNWGTTPVGRFQIGEVQTGRIYDVVFDDTEIDVPG